MIRRSAAWPARAAGLAVLLLLAAGESRAQQVKPRLVILFDTSGSMLKDPPGIHTYGDGSAEHLGVDTNCDGTAGNDSRLFQAKNAVTDIINGFGEVEFALARFHQDQDQDYAGADPCSGQCCSYDDPTDNTGTSCGTTCGVTRRPDNPPSNPSDPYVHYAGCCCVDGAGMCGPNNFPCSDFGYDLAGADILVGLDPDNQSRILTWMDHAETNFVNTTTSGDYCAGGDCELRGIGGTPIGASLTAVGDYLAPIRMGDAAAGCRSYSVILLTDGQESCECGGSQPACPLSCGASSGPARRAADLNLIYGITTYVVGFATTAADASQLDAIALCGGTGAAYFASDQTELSIALSRIVSGSIPQELCNAVDDDCDGETDEGFPGAYPPGSQACGTGPCQGFVCCTSPSSSDCCGPPPGTEECNGEDDDCDGLTDEGFPQFCGCAPQAEVCNAMDDDCDGLTDEGFAPGACGTDVGECAAGTTACQAGNVVCDGAVGPTPEVCDCLDNNCDSVTDEIASTCYEFAAGCDLVSGRCDGTCRIGLHACTAATCPSFGECTGDVGPSAEVCDGLDNDCDGMVDEGGTCCAMAVEVCNAEDDDCDGLTDESFPEDGLPCGQAIGECEPGSTICVAGDLGCSGGVGPGTEVCNGLDDDCDGSVDEDLAAPVGSPCGDDEGVCEPGALACVNGLLQCPGGKGPAPERCDCQDNDCDATTDEQAPCPPGGACDADHCACVLPCAQDEFPCPGGFLPRDDPPGQCFCVPDVCADLACGGCERCEARGGQAVCVPNCEGVICTEHEVCDCGACRDDSCATHGCPAGSVCIDYECVPNPCAGVSCSRDELCREGLCCPSRCDGPCGTGESCRVENCMALCTPDPCAGVACLKFQVCREGRCELDPCASVRCSQGQTCCDGRCVADPCLTSSCDTHEACDAAALCRSAEPCRFLGTEIGEGIRIVATGAGGCPCAVGTAGEPWAPPLLLLLAIASRRRKR
jgi:MYXO-CTERM domain-containing protein